MFSDTAKHFRNYLSITSKRDLDVIDTSEQGAKMAALKTCVFIENTSRVFSMKTQYKHRKKKKEEEETTSTGGVSSFHVVIIRDLGVNGSLEKWFKLSGRG